MSTKKRDYYQVMGLSKSATETDIKKAYKKLAIKWHPDKNLDNKQQATNKFRQISQAYQILSDGQKRKAYDSYGFDAPKHGTSFKFHDADQIFKHFFSNFGDEDDFKGFGSGFSSFFGNKNGKKGASFGGFGGFGDDDDFFKGFGSSGFGNSGFSSFSSSSFGGGMPGMTSTSTSTVTKTVNGKTVTVKKSTVTNADGSKTVTQQTIDNGNKVKKQYSLGPTQKGPSSNKAVNYY